MFRHNLLLIYRNFKRFNDTFFINLIGLSTGLACALLIYLWVNDELSIDKFHEKDEQLFQVMSRRETANGINVGTEMPPVLAEALAEEFPEVEYAVAEAVNVSNNALSVDDKVFNVFGIYAGNEYFNIFSYELIQGDKDQILSDEYNIVISEDLAMKLFNTIDNVVGRSVVFEHKEQFIISGIYTIPYNSSKDFDFILPHRVVFKQFPNVKNDWSSSFMFNTYLILKEGTNIAEFNNKIKDVIKTKSNQGNITLFATSYSGNYLYGKYENGVQTGGRIEYVKLFSIIAIFILIIACINFMNLSTAKASRRIKEVGIKKAIGAARETLIFQYLGESMLMTCLSLLTAIILVTLFLSQFNQITGKQLTLDFDVNLILSFVGITLFTGLIAGSYPALYLSGFNPAIVLKGQLYGSVGELWARKGLVIFQFTLSVILIVAVIVVYKQIEFVQTKNLGYDKDNIIHFETEGKVKEHLETFLSEVKNIPGIINASSTFLTFLGNLNSTSDLSWQGKAPDYNAEMQYRRVNYDMIELIDIKMKEGRAFSRDFSSEDSKIIFNEAAIKTMGLTDPINKTVKLWGHDYEILGVVQNFHFESLHKDVKPLFFLLMPERTNTIMLRIESERLMETIDDVQEYYSEFTQGLPLEYKFLDEEYQAQYVAEQRVSTLSRYFAGFAIIISCLGLFGLAAFTAERRLKEIGIRKILGSSEFGILRLLSGDFTKMVLMAIVIALPISYIIVKKWLDNFAFKIDLEWWFFIGAGLIVLLIAWFTVGLQMVKATKVNPAQCLRDE